MQKYFDEKATDCSVNKSRLIAPAKIFVAKIASSERDGARERSLEQVCLCVKSKRFAEQEGL